MSVSETLPSLAHPAAAATVTPAATGQTVAYVRVSSTDQNTARQHEAVGPVARTFEDRVSGKSREPRVELARMIEYVRDVDLVKVASFDRLARSLADLLAIVAEINAKGAAVYFVKEHLTFRPGDTNPYARFQMQVLGAAAELERNLIRERQREGIALAKGRGAYRGRRPVLDSTKITEARRLLDQGVPLAKVARGLDVSRSSLYRALAGQGTYAPAPASPAA